MIKPERNSYLYILFFNKSGYNANLDIKYSDWIFIQSYRENSAIWHNSD